MRAARFAASRERPRARRAATCTLEQPAQRPRLRHSALLTTRPAATPPLRLPLPASTPVTPLQEELAWAPFTPSGRLPPASAFLPRPFSHSARSAFRPPPAPEAEAAPPLLPVGAQDARAQLKAMLQAQLASRLGGSPAGAPGSAAALLKTLAGAAAAAPADALRSLRGLDDDRKRLLLAQKLLMVRAALQARIARKRAAALAAQPQQAEPAPARAAPTLQPAGSG